MAYRGASERLVQVRGKLQELFHNMMVKAQSFLTKYWTWTPHNFRNLLQENISLEIPHGEAGGLKSLKPDIVVVQNEHEASNPLNFGQFLCVMEHRRGVRAMSNSDAKIVLL